MANLQFYKQNLGVSGPDDLERIFLDSLIESNFTYDYFVDWDKVFQKRDEYRNELALLSSLRGVPDPKAHLIALIAKYPDVVKAIPILIAERELTLKVLHSHEPEIQYLIYNFRPGEHSDAQSIVYFCERTGLLRALSSMDSPVDYATGVEVGLDSNARKNRSGDFMEHMVSEVLGRIVAADRRYKRFSQKQFKYLESNLALSIPQGLRDRKFDEVVVRGNHGVNIETNFYSRTGSKPTEIVESYITRKAELNSIGWTFVWVTDGIAWRQMTNQLRRGIVNFEYTLNLYMCAKGLLDKIFAEDR